MLNKGGNLIAGKQFTDLTKASALKDTNIIAVHDGNGLKKASMEDVTMYMADKFSNPNLLINPDFKINQKGKESYTSGGFEYTVDRWRVSSAKVSVSDNGLMIQSTGNSGSWVSQKFEKELEGVFTLSVKVSNINGKAYLTNPTNRVTITSAGIYSVTLSNLSEFNMFIEASTSVTIEWAKLEQGSIATPFVAPNYMEELMKCRYFYYQANVGAETVGQIGQQVKFNIPYLCMRTNPTAKISTDGDANKLILSDSADEKVLGINAYRDIGNTHIEITTDTNKTGVFSLSGVVEIELDSEIY